MRNLDRVNLVKFFGTPPSPCPYIPGRVERQVVTPLTCDDADTIHNNLARSGFRRSYHIAYKPLCEGCNACVPVRVRAEDFKLTKSLKRVLRRNSDVRANRLPPVARLEHYDLFRLYLESRHSEGSMADMGLEDFRAMIEDTPVETSVVEFRKGNDLYGVCLTDTMDDGLSLVYSMFDPKFADDSPGTYIILWHLEQAKRMGLPYVYLGYWVASCRKMTYKIRFQPTEALGKNGWTPLEMLTFGE